MSLQYYFKVIYYIYGRNSSYGRKRELFYKMCKRGINFSIDFQDGEKLSIWYYEKEKVASIKKQMYEMDVEYVNEVLKAYYDELSGDEKLLYNSYIEKEKMLNISNYYLLLTRNFLDKSKVYRNPVNFDKDDHFLLLILNLNEDTLFSFEVIQ